MNKIAEQAIRGLNARGFPSTRGMCQKYARISVQDAIGHGYDDVLQKASAKEAALSLRGAGLAHNHVPGEVIQPGDLLYKIVGSGGFGHVGVFVGNLNGVPSVAENSSYHVRNGGNDARGIRTLKQFGEFQIVARFPVPDEKPVEEKPAVPPVQNSVIIVASNGQPMRITALKDKDVNWSPVRKTLEAAGVDVTREGVWSDGTPALYVKAAQ